MMFMTLTRVENLDLSPIHLILWKDLHKQGSGRPVEYQPNWDLKDLMLRQLLQIPYMKGLIARAKPSRSRMQSCPEKRERSVPYRILFDLIARAGDSARR